MGEIQWMSSTPGGAPVPVCSATRTLRDRAPGVSYREEACALGQWVPPEGLCKCKPLVTDKHGQGTVRAPFISCTPSTAHAMR